MEPSACMMRETEFSSGVQLGNSPEGNADPFFKNLNT
jgi:hypothetical protein